MRFIASIFALLFAASPALAEPPPLPMPWVKLSEIYYTPTQVRLYGAGSQPPSFCTISQPCNAVYVMTHLPTSIGNYGPPATNCVDPPTCNQWASNPITVDLAPFGIAEDAKVAWLSGMLIITHGTTVETADIHVTFAAYGGPIDCTRYLGQTVEPHVGGGQRSNMSTLVPLSERKFQFCYFLNTPGEWPDNSSYGINLSIQAWGR